MRVAVKRSSNRRRTARRSSAITRGKATAASSIQLMIRPVSPSSDEQQKSDFLGQALALMFLIDWPEPFGLSMIEAMACGTPVLALRRGSVEEVDRRAVRRRFEERFTATRMANDYVRVYNALLTQEHAKLVTNQVNPLFETAAEPTAEPIEMVHDDLGTSSAAHTW